jgi:hypothetical protein
MTTETVEDQKLIAQLMGLVKVDDNYSSGRSIEYKPGAFVDYEAMGEGWLKYHSDWNALMPALKKCKDIGFSYDFEHKVYIAYEDHFHPDYTLSEFLQNDIEALHGRVVAFIKWLDKNQAEY